MIFVRSALFNAFFFVSTVALSIYGIPLRWIAPDRVGGLIRFWARIEIAAARRVCGIRYVVRGGEHLPAAAALLACQHQSTFDTLIWFLLLPRCIYVVKRELARLPGFGGLVRRSGMIVVDRQAGATALRGLVRDGRRAAAAGGQIVIFPEGTRARPGQDLPLQPGVAALATATGLPVIPVLTDSGRTWSRRAFRKRAGVIRIQILPPLPAGLPRAVLIGHLGELFRRGPSVDNSVDHASGMLPVHPSCHRDGADVD